MNCNPFTISYETYCERSELDPLADSSKAQFSKFLETAVRYSDCFTPPPTVRERHGKTGIRGLFQRKKSVAVLGTVSGKYDQTKQREAPPLGKGAFGAVYHAKITTVDRAGKRRETPFDYPIIQKQGVYESGKGWPHDREIMVREILMLRLMNFHGVKSVPQLRSSGISEVGPETTVTACMVEVPHVKPLDVISSEIRAQLILEDKKEAKASK